jgi:hypothetical protein
MEGFGVEVHGQAYNNNSRSIDKANKKVKAFILSNNVC